MPKLSKEYRFLDLSDYGRSTAILIADHLKDSRLTPTHITILFTISGLLAVHRQFQLLIFSPDSKNQQCIFLLEFVF